eukprot:COSAG02_NODE_58529_length_277_cov_0.578652_1_plen_22_part_10
MGIRNGILTVNELVEQWDNKSD